STLDGRILDCNPSFAAMLGYDSMAQMQARPCAAFYWQPADRDALLAELQKQHVLTNREVCLRHKQGHPVWVLANLNLIEEGMPVIQSTIIDITERKKALAALIE